MKELLQYIVRESVSKKDDVLVSETIEDGVLNLTLKVNDEDLGTVLGKNGRTIKAIRDLLRIKAQKTNLRFNLSLAHEDLLPSSNDSKKIDL